MEQAQTRLFGVIEGKTTTNSFKVKVLANDVERSSFLEVFQDGAPYVCSIKELYRTERGVYAECYVIGQGPKLPFTPGSPVYIANEDNVRRALKLSIDPSTGLYIGKLKGLNCKVWLPIKKLGRMFIVGKPGSGKSYTAGVIIEELLKKGISVLIIDVHGEYSSLKVMGDITSDEYEVYPRSYSDVVVEFGDPKVNPGVDVPLNTLETASPEDIVVPGQCTIINLRGLLKEEQISFTASILEKVFQALMDGRLKPFYCVLDEAHRFAGREKVKSTDIVRRFAQEGRKFGAGLIVITQRPQLLDTTVRGLVGTWIIHRLSDPNDMRITLESGGLDREWEDKIAWLESGEAVISGEAVEKIPIMVKVRPRETKHGGEGFNPLDYAVKAVEGIAAKSLEKLSKTVTRESNKLQKQPLSALGLPQAFLPVLMDESEILTKMRSQVAGFEADVVSLELTYMPALYCEVKAYIERQNPHIKYSESIRRLIPVGIEVGEIDWDSVQAYGLELKDVESLELLTSPPRPGFYQKTCFNISESKVIKRIKGELLAYAASKFTRTVFYSEALGKFSLTGDRHSFMSECLEKLTEIEKSEERNLEENLTKSMLEINRAIDGYRDRLQKLGELYNALRYECERLENQLKEAKKQKRPILKLLKQLESMRKRLDGIRDEMLKINTQIKVLNEKRKSLDDEYKRKLREAKLKIEELKKLDVKSMIIQPEEDELSIPVFQLVWIPVYRAKMMVTGSKLSREAVIQWNAVNGGGSYGSCLICGIELSNLTSLAVCDVCLHLVCQLHTTRCQACGARVCTKDSWTCESCKKTLCSKEPSLRCKRCEAMLCQECAGRCMKCGDEVAYCSGHLRTCSLCSSTLCDDHYEAHLVKCDCCSKIMCESTTLKCHVCYKLMCQDCFRVCVNCNRVVCDEHSWTCKTCGQTFCINEKRETCYTCHADVCSSHAHVCEICGRTSCNDHAYKCSACGKLLCKTCIGEIRGFIIKKVLCTICTKTS